MVSYIEEALKNNFLKSSEIKETFQGENWLSFGEGHPTADSSPTPTIAVFNQGFNGFLIGLLSLKIFNGDSSRKGGDPWKGVESNVQSKVDLHHFFWGSCGFHHSLLREKILGRDRLQFKPGWVHINKGMDAN
ncbi:hypothetical protein M9H77_30927 [Catharanthus roseus]|uniref:Uncharacterized protein n=1 Tax=Catharanthus roseus TaxID=4058 RepID=A0ACB9ZYM3_CATRO|nr:hypothetical protein M9H77_30927 [Catharanthus roseus]